MSERAILTVEYGIFEDTFGVCLYDSEQDLLDRVKIFRNLYFASEIKRITKLVRRLTRDVLCPLCETKLERPYSGNGHLHGKRQCLNPQCKFFDYLIDPHLKLVLGTGAGESYDSWLKVKDLPHYSTIEDPEPLWKLFDCCVELSIEIENLKI